MSKLFQTISEINKVYNSIEKDFTNRKNELKNIKSIPVENDNYSFFTPNL